MSVILKELPKGLLVIGWIDVLHYTNRNKKVGFCNLAPSDSNKRGLETWTPLHPTGYPSRPYGLIVSRSWPIHAETTSLSWIFSLIAMLQRHLAIYVSIFKIYWLLKTLELHQLKWVYETHWDTDLPPALFYEYWAMGLSPIGAMAGLGCAVHTSGLN